MKTIRVSPRTVALLRNVAAIEGRTLADVARDAVDQLMREVIAERKAKNQHSEKPNG